MANARLCKAMVLYALLLLPMVAYATTGLGGLTGLSSMMEKRLFILALSLLFAVLWFATAVFVVFRRARRPKSAVVQMIFALSVGGLLYWADSVGIRFGFRPYMAGIVFVLLGFFVLRFEKSKTNEPV